MLESLFSIQWIKGYRYDIRGGIECLTADPEAASLSQLSHITSIEIDHEIISMIILPLLLIQEGQLSVTGEYMYTKIG